MTNNLRVKKMQGSIYSQFSNIHSLEEIFLDNFSINKINRYIINKHATIIFWKDGTKSISKLNACDDFDKEIGVMLAWFKKYCKVKGISNNDYKRLMGCLNETSMKDYLFIIFNNETFKDAEKSRKYLYSLKLENEIKRGK